VLKLNSKLTSSLLYRNSGLIVADSIQRTALLVNVKILESSLSQL